MKRPVLDTVIRSPQGSALAGATAFVYRRGTTTQIPCYAAATGGSALSQPLTADANGRVYVFVDNVWQADVVTTINGTAVTQEIDLHSGAIDTWITPTMLNSWVSAAGWPAAAYQKTPDGMTIVRGLVASGTVGSPIFQLGTGFKPASGILVFPTTAGGAYGRLHVNNSGGVILNTGSNAWVELAPIKFFAEA